jgi:predicted acylesterase/phospholipase RssA
MRQHIGIAISGGGHRATLWGLGPLLYLVDAGKHSEVAAISSVSGGSITNGVIAHEMDLTETEPADFDGKVAGLVRHVANTGLFFWGPATNAYVVSLLVGAGLGLLGLVVGIVLLALEGLSWRTGLALIASIVVLAAVARWFQQRSDVVDRALARTHFSRDGRATQLAAVTRSVDHVICATELQSGRHFYLSPRFLYSYEFGVGSPAGMSLSTAVQASACLPGAFSPRRLKTGGYGFTRRDGRQAPTEMLLTDGGVYDNMADQWPGGLSGRLERLPDLPMAQRDIDEVVVINGSSPLPWTPMRRARLVLAGEFATLSRVNSVMYQVTTARRRASLVSDWNRAAQTGQGQRGALVNIAQTPYTVADFYHRRADAWPDRAKRAEAVLKLLGDDETTRAGWQARAKASRDVATVLRKLGVDTTLALLEHSYVLAMCNLHVLLDYPLLPLPARERFTRLLGQAAPVPRGR